MNTLEEIRARDVALHYCATCGNRVHPEDIDTRTDPHFTTVVECERRLAKEGRKAAAPEEIEQYGYGLRGLCWDPGAHHPFIEGEPPNSEEADRRWLLRYIDSGEAWRAPFAPALGESGR